MQTLKLNGLEIFRDMKILGSSFYKYIVFRNFASKFPVICGLVFGLSAVFPVPIYAQSRPPASSDGTMYWIFLIILVIALAGVVFFWWRKKNEVQIEVISNAPRNPRPATTGKKITDTKSAKIKAKREDREVEAWIQEQAQIVQDSVIKPGEKRDAAKTAQEAIKRKTAQALSTYTDNLKSVAAKIPMESLPIFKINRIVPITETEALFYVDDEDLEDAIIQIRQEDDDEDVREIAVRVLSAFRAQNAVECLAQVAHYDLSQRLRVAAVISLGEYDHPAVFEAILIACADPTREVKAAAARTLIKLSFYRGDSFAHILQSENVERIRMAAMACIESGFAERAFDRLLSTDYRQAYEAFVILSILVKAGHSDVLLEAVETHRTPQVRFAALHILEVTQPANLPTLLLELSGKPLAPELRKAILEVLEKTGVPV